METKALLDIIKLRVNLTQGNPTEEIVLNEVIKALERLIQYEKIRRDKSIIKHL